MDSSSELRQRLGTNRLANDKPLRRQSNLITTVANPFCNPAPWTLYEKCKATVNICTLFPVRLLVFMILFPIQITVATIASIGYPLEEDRGCLRHIHPLPFWRRLFMWPISLTNRGLLWSLGFWRIKIRDLRQDPKKGANILVVAPHQTMTDPFMLGYAFPPLPSGVAKADLLNLPFLGAMARAGQGIFVDRKNADSRHACKDAIAARADPSLWKGPPTMIFPEGTTTNGEVLIQFKLGAFCPGKPVLPVCLRYPSEHFNPGWCGRNSNLGMALFRMMLQFKNSCEIIILDPYEPSSAEKQDAKLFANNVRKLMAAHLALDTTEHSYDDLFLMSGAKAGQGSDFEVAEVVSLYKFSMDELKAALKIFEKLDRANSGFISHEEFSQALRDGALGEVRASASIDHLFAFFDTDGDGTIAYREFVQGLALLSNRCSLASRAKLAFLAYDVEGKGKVQRGILRKALNDAVLHPSSECQGDGDMSPGEQVLARRKTSDLGDSEEIGFDDFVQLIESQPELLDAGLEIARTRLGAPSLGAQQDGGQ